MELLILISLLWILCGILSYGIAYGYFSRKYPLRDPNIHKVWAIKWELFGPISLIVGFFLSKRIKYGTRYI